MNTIKTMRPIHNTSDSDMESVLSTAKPESTSAEPPEKYVCRFECCGKTFRRLVQLDRHEFKHTGIKKHACFHAGCSKTYTNTQHLKRHLKTFHEKKEQTKNVKCSFEFCEKMFISNFNMERHIRDVHENPKVFKCNQCGEKFKQRIKLRRHEVKHTGLYPYNCTECSKGFVQEYFFLRHACTKSYKCDQCEETFGKWTHLLAHRKELDHKPVHKCDQCPKQYKSRLLLAEHKNTHEEVQEVYKCTHEGCSRFYTYKRNLFQHVRTAHDGKTFPCTFEGCDLKLSCKTALENHIKVIHNKMQIRTPKTTNKPRSKRKDAGKRKQSALSKLSGVVIDKKLDQEIMEGTATVQIDSEALRKEILMGIGEEKSDTAEDL